jgi:xylulokinase
VGLKLTTTKGEITKGLLEGVALEMKLNLQLMEKSGMKIDTFIATGGGTRNKAWTQLKADVLNKKILVREVGEAGCYGASLLARSAVEKTSADQLVQHDRIEAEIFVPNPENAESYQRLFEKYKQLYPALQSFWKT